MNIGDVVGVMYPEEPPVGTVVVGDRIGDTYKSGVNGWKCVNHTELGPFSWTKVIDRERYVRIKTLPPYVGGDVSSLDSLPVHSIVTAVGGQFLLVKIDDNEWLQYCAHTTSLRLRKEGTVSGSIYRVLYLPEGE